MPQLISQLDGGGSERGDLFFFLSSDRIDVVFAGGPMLLPAHGGKDRGMCVVPVVLVVRWKYMYLDGIHPWCLRLWLSGFLTCVEDWLPFHIVDK